MQANKSQANGARLVCSDGRKPHALAYVLTSAMSANRPFFPSPSGVMFGELCPMTRSDVVRILRELPRLQPDPGWKRRTKRRLLRAYDGWFARVSALRHWAIYVSSRSDATDVANAIVARGQSWRPMTVAPDRLTEAVLAIHPALVVIDGELPESDRLMERVRELGSIITVTDFELLGRAA